MGDFQGPTVYLPWKYHEDLLKFGALPSRAARAPVICRQAAYGDAADLNGGSKLIDQVPASKSSQRQGILLWLYSDSLMELKL